MLRHKRNVMKKYHQPQGAGDEVMSVVRSGIPFLAWTPFFHIGGSGLKLGWTSVC